MRRNAISPASHSILSRTVRAGLMATLLAGVSTGAMAQLSAQDISRLGADLTGAGAIKAGNADGSIPAYTGGLGKDVTGNPFASEKPLYTITAANAAQYRDKLTTGQLALLERYPTYKINVYPSHRTASLPQAQLDYIKSEAATAKLANGGNGVQGVEHSTVPFPIPQTGVEPMWNHMMRYRGGNTQKNTTEFPVHTDGNFTPVRRIEWLARAADIGSPEPNRMQYYKNLVTAPSSIAGEAILTHDPLDQVAETRLAWTYNPGQRRVLRAPSVSYDSPGTGTDGLRTMDDYDGYNGAPDRFDWKLIGKKEIIIPYNNFALADKSVKYKDVIKPNHIDQDLVRYELHRVWVVEATVKSGVRHIYSKRQFYIDEDSWHIAIKDQYDGRGELWRVHEMYLKPVPEHQIMEHAASSMYDLQARRYIVHNLNNEEKPARYGVKYELNQFSPDSLRRIGN